MATQDEDRTTRTDHPTAPTAARPLSVVPEPPREPAQKARYHARTARTRCEFAGLSLQDALELARMSRRFGDEAERLEGVREDLGVREGKLTAELDVANRRADTANSEQEYAQADEDAIRLRAELAQLDLDDAATLNELDDVHAAGTLAREGAEWALKVAQVGALDAIAHALTGLALVETGAVIPPRRHWAPVAQDGGH